MEPKNWVNIGFSLIALIVFFVSKQVMLLVFDLFRLPVFDEWVVSLPVITALVLGLVTFFGLKKWNAANQFGLEVVSELAKVTWPLRKETLVSTVIVAIMVGIASLFLVTFDTVWAFLTTKFFSL